MFVVIFRCVSSLIRQSLGAAQVGTCLEDAQGHVEIWGFGRVHEEGFVARQPVKCSPPSHARSVQVTKLLESLLDLHTNKSGTRYFSFSMKAPTPSWFQLRLSPDCVW